MDALRGCLLGLRQARESEERLTKLREEYEKYEGKARMDLKR